MADLGPPIPWDDADTTALAAVTPADQKATDAYVAALGSSLLQALYAAQPLEADTDG
jgi:hypothetical protein